LTPAALAGPRDMSPIHHLHAGVPPFLLVHGDADGSVPFEQSPLFQARVRERGGRCEVLRLPGAPHRLSEWERFQPDYVDRIVAWLTAALAAASADPGARRR